MIFCQRDDRVVLLKGFIATHTGHDVTGNNDPFIVHSQYIQAAFQLHRRHFEPVQSSA